jgi:hypothetical protein
VYLFNTPGSAPWVTATAAVPGTVSAPVKEFWVVLEKFTINSSSADGYVDYLDVTPRLIPPQGTLIAVK